MVIRLKNSINQSCRFCASGPSKYKVEHLNGDVEYVCEAHRIEHYPDIPIDPTPEPEPAPIV